MISQLGTWYEHLVKWECVTDRTFDTIDVLYENGKIYPNKKDIFRAFRECEYDNCRVVMFFQDPYHNGVATGLATAVENNKIPKSLEVIFREIQIEYGKCTTNPNLLSWCKQGVLLLNAALTVEEGTPSSHIKLWSRWTKRFISGLSKDKNVIWVLFGKHVQKYKSLISRGIVICVPHPAAELYSGGTAGFYKSGVFKNINSHLNQIINWNE